MNKTVFCNGFAHKIDNPVLKEKIMCECDRLFGFPIKRDYFPGPQPVTVEKKDFETLKKGYVVCEKSDGERHVMLLINIDNKPMCFLINRNNELYFLSLAFKKELFEGSIFDGELIKTKAGVWNYLIHDCMVYNGKSYIDISHDLRYSAVIDFITKRYVNKPTDCFNIKTKLFYIYGNKLLETWKHISETTENEIDGLIFTPINEPIKFGRDYSLLKWKMTHTIDFFVKKIGKKINLYGYRKNDYYLYKSITETNKSFELISNFKDINLKNGTIIEFKYDNLEIFTPYRIRSDKDKPNGEITINNTLKNIEEAITIETFVFLT
jgi:mRNA guanylyltransferase